MVVLHLIFLNSFKILNLLSLYRIFVILKVMENYKRPTPDSAATRNRDEEDEVDGDLLLPREGERVENRHTRYSFYWIRSLPFIIASFTSEIS